MRATTGPSSAGSVGGRPIVSGGLPGEAASTPAGEARFDVGRIVYEPARERVVRVESAHAPAPVLYRVSLPEGGPHGFAYDADLRAATRDQIATFERTQQWSPDHGPTR